MAARRSGSSRSSPTAAAIAATESSTMNPVRPSRQHGRRPGHGRRHGREAAQPRLDQHARHALTGGQAGEHQHVRAAEEFGHIRTGTEELDALGRRQGGQGPGERPVADHDGADGVALGPQAAYDLDEPIGPLLRCQRTHEYERGGRLPRPAPIGDGTGRGLVRWVSPPPSAGGRRNRCVHSSSTSSPTATTSSACAMMRLHIHSCSSVGGPA